MTFKLEKCCCFVNLRMGAIILGVLNALSLDIMGWGKRKFKGHSLWGAPANMTLYCKLYLLFIADLPVLDIYIGSILYIVLSHIAMGHLDDYDKSGLTRAQKKTLAIAGLVSGYLGLVLSGILLFGAIQRKRAFVLIWCVVVALGIAVWTVLYIIAAFTEPYILASLIGCALSFYFWYCVFSFYLELKQQ